MPLLCSVRRVREQRVKLLGSAEPNYKIVAFSPRSEVTSFKAPPFEDVTSAGGVLGVFVVDNNTGLMSPDDPRLVHRSNVALYPSGRNHVCGPPSTLQIDLNLAFGGVGQASYTAAEL